MTEPATNVVHLVDHNGEASADCANCIGLEQELRTKRAQITRLKNENARLMGVEPEHRAVLDVMEFWREHCHPNAGIVVGSAAWKAVRDRLRDKDAASGEALFTPLHLKGATIGVLLSDWHVQRKSEGKLYPQSFMADADRVQKHITRASTFKRTYGVSALALVDELAGAGLVWLAERCTCGGLYIEHLRGGVTPDGRFPLARTDCENYDDFSARLDRHYRELEERAREGDPKAQEAVEWVDWLEGKRRRERVA